jgi:hypothetical protein
LINHDHVFIRVLINFVIKMVSIYLIPHKRIFGFDVQESPAARGAVGQGGAGVHHRGGGGQANYQVSWSTS